MGHLLNPLPQFLFNLTGMPQWYKWGVLIHQQLMSTINIASQHLCSNSHK